MSASLLHSLQQISQSADSIAQLPFPPPKIFTNALLQPHDITTLIRDTEPHERALFSVDTSINAHTQPSRRRTVLPATNNSNNNNDATTSAARAPSSMASRIYAAQDSKYRQSAVARVLGGDMMSQIRRSTAGSQRPGGGSGGVDVELLLKGAEMLCSVYPVAGAQDRIDTLRMQYQQYAGVLQRLEYEVQCQAAELEKMSYRGRQQQQQYDEDEMDLDEPEGEGEEEKVTDADIQQEIEAIRGLEQRKRDLERRVDGLDQNIGQMMG
ncbi:hypothetical protein KEM56_001260 [Ascosphaera pollenicola]|nr:hypothetical protein KEM56_001260 [Ascosphaera pollenicola]